MVKSIVNSFLTMIIMTLITGMIYPLATTGITKVLFPVQASGSLLASNGTVVGSKLIGQNFAGAGYFHGRPSAAGSDGYDASSSSGSNLGPTNAKLLASASERITQIKAENNLADSEPLPGDLVLASASGLDPHITPAAAALQVKRVAMARGLSMAEVNSLVQHYTEDRQFGFLGEPRINVLELNLALDNIK